VVDIIGIKIFNIANIHAITELGNIPKSIINNIVNEMKKVPKENSDVICIVSLIFAFFLSAIK